MKPSNVLLSRTGDFKLCDFGISGRLVDSIAKTMEVGCRPYMAVSGEGGGRGREGGREERGGERREREGETEERRREGEGGTAEKGGREERESESEGERGRESLICMYMYIVCTILYELLILI